MMVTRALFITAPLFATCFFGQIAIAEETSHTLRFKVLAPTLGADDSLYVTGNHPAIGNWNPNGLMLHRRDDDRHVGEIFVPHGTKLEFKFTLGSWDREALNPDGSVPPNHSLVVNRDTVIENSIGRFRTGTPQEPPSGRGSGVLGRLVYHHDVKSQYLKFDRHVAVWLPPGYGTHADQRYPVLYMHDGQNLFDPRIANTGIDWGADEAAANLIEAGKIPQIIIVGVFSTPARSLEYNPFREGPAYAKFLIEELKPMIDDTYHTRAEASHTATAGSSAGGLISIYLGMAHGDVFTRIAALSAHIPPIPSQFGGTDESFVEWVKKHGPPAKNLRIYIDRSTEGIDAMYGPYHAEFKAIYEKWGWADDQNLMVRKFESTRHTEADWRKRLHIPMEFIFAD